MTDNAQNTAQDSNADAAQAEAAKSAAAVMNGEDLAKALDAVTALISSGAAGREQELMNKSLAGNMSGAEKAELVALLTGDKANSIAKAATQSLDPNGNEIMKGAIDGSEYIETLHSSLLKSFDVVAKALEKSDDARERETVVLAKALVEIGKIAIASAKLTKSLEGKLETWGRAPANTPRGLNPAGRGPAGNGANGVAKGLGGQTGEAGSVPAAPMVGRQQILDSLLSMAEKNGATNFAKSGETYVEAVSKFEISNEIHPALLKDVMDMIGANRGAQS